MSAHTVVVGAKDMRTHVILPRELVDRIDALVGPRRRSQFIAELTSRELARLELLEAARAAAGSLPEGTVADWDTEEDISTWLRELRGSDHERDDRLDQLRRDDGIAP